MLNASSSRALELAAHYGIPRSLPKPPQPILRPTSPTAAQSQALLSVPTFEAMKASYLSMLANKPVEHPSPSTFTESSVIPPTNYQSSLSAPALEAMKMNYLSMSANKPIDHLSPSTSAVPPMNPAPTNAELGIPSEEVLQPIIDMMKASPQFRASQLGEYLTSPYGTPYDDFNTSPMDDSPFIPDLNTPIMDHIDDFDYVDPPSGWGDAAPLFSDEYDAQNPVQPETEAKETQASTASELFNNAKLYAFSPSSPVLEDFNVPITQSAHSPVMDPVPSLYPSRRAPTSSQAHSTSDIANRSRSKPRGPSLNATGTRKDITPETMISFSAPTQTRSYLLPSATSRKDFPQHAARKRSHSQAFGDSAQEQDELTGEAPPGPNATEVEHIEWKRRQNTLAARKSRKRKLEYLREVEAECAEVKTDRDRWKVRCGVLEGVLQAHGMAVPKWDDD